MGAHAHLAGFRINDEKYIKIPEGTAGQRVVKRVVAEESIRKKRCKEGVRTEKPSPPLTPSTQRPMFGLITDLLPGHV